MTVASGAVWHRNALKAKSTEQETFSRPFFATKSSDPKTGPRETTGTRATPYLTTI